MGKAKENKAPPARKPRAAKKAPPAEVEFVPRFHENPRAAFTCSCDFPDKCDGSGLIHCLHNTIVGLTEPDANMCECKACPPRLGEHVNACPGCENCLATVCAACGKRDPDVSPVVEGETWTCSPECTRKMFTVAS